MNNIWATKSVKDIFDLAILPALLNNGEVFHIHDLKIQISLEDIQYKLWRGVLAVPKSCPLPSLLYESESWMLKYRVYSKIVNFVKHVHCHDESTSLSKQILSQQLINGWPGLSKYAITRPEVSEADPQRNKSKQKVTEKCLICQDQQSNKYTRNSALFRISEQTS